MVEEEMDITYTELNGDEIPLDRRELTLAVLR